MAVATVSNQIDQKVEPELVAIGPGQAGGLNASHRIIGVHVNDWNFESTRETARVARAVRLFRFGREPKLVIGDDMNDPADLVPVEPRQIQGFRNDTLSRERRIAMDQNCEHAACVDDRRAWRIHARRRRAGHPM
jgi:hypothetical protein